MREIGINQVYSHRNRELKLVTATKSTTKETEIGKH